MKISHWVFTESATETEACAQIEEAALWCPWSHQWNWSQGALKNGEMLTDALGESSIAYEANVENLCKVIGDRKPQDIAATTHTLDAPDQDTSWLLLVAALAETTHGLWTPWSGGYDAHTGSGHLEKVVERLAHHPHKQWAGLIIFNPDA